MLRSMLCALALAAVGCSADVPEINSQPLHLLGGSSTIQWTTCPADFTGECAWVPLPLDYADPEGKTIPVFVARKLAESGKARAQLWLLEGGPGGSGNGYTRPIEGSLSRAFPDIDFYVIEHRGVGESARLECPVYESQTSDGGWEITPDELPACAEALKAQWGDGLLQFTTTADAHDLASLIERTREPDKQVFIYGASYGTTRALRFLQAHPDAADAVVLDSIAAPGVQFLSDFDKQADPVAQELAQLCAADPICGEKLGSEPWEKITEIIKKLQRGHCPDFLYRSQLQPLGAQLLASREFRVHIFALLYRLDRCEGEDAYIANNYFDILTEETAPTYLRNSRPLGLLIALSEIWPEPSPSLEELRSVCDEQVFCFETGTWIGAGEAFWPRYPRDEYVNKWPTSDVPILAMNGTLDPQTPIEKASRAATALSAPHQTFIAIPFSPHVVLEASPVQAPDQPSCGLQLMRSFLQDPRGKLDTSCLNDLEPIDFSPKTPFELDLFRSEDIWGDELQPEPATAPIGQSRELKLNRINAWPHKPVISER